MSKRNIGIIGTGARAKFFARQLRDGVCDTELFGLCDISEERLKNFADQLGLKDVRKFTSNAEFLAQPELEGVIITVPEFAHAEVACAAMRAGKAIYVEKPLAATIDDCRRIVKCQRETGAKAYVGFNNRHRPGFAKVREIIKTGILGKLLHIQGLEQLSQAHSASFMRRLHRKTKNTGGLLNHKCSHDLDLLQWFVGHEHRVVKVAAFASRNVFAAKKAPATHCRYCPGEIKENCPYRDKSGFTLQVGRSGSNRPEFTDNYPGDLCAFSADKDIFEDHAVILEWNNGVVGGFNLVHCQAVGRREIDIWGEKGRLHWGFDEPVRIALSDTGEIIEHHLPIKPEIDGGHATGHGGADFKMMRNFVHCMEGRLDEPSALEHGLAATLLAVKALESHNTRRVMEIAPEEYMV